MIFEYEDMIMQCRHVVVIGIKYKLPVQVAVKATWYSVELSHRGIGFKTRPEYLLWKSR